MKALIQLSHRILLEIRALVQFELLEVLLHFLTISILASKYRASYIILHTSLGQGLVARQVGKFSGCSTHNLC